jgi:hypothetical protein
MAPVATERLRCARRSSRPRRMLDMHEEGTFEQTCTSQGLRSLICACPFRTLARSLARPLLQATTMLLLDWEWRVVERGHNSSNTGEESLLLSK